ncbi:DUF1559 family PulG-like putative transporter [Candidatus Laterigemmans baculatus]|uniref:DUF1559 family PulG-like putative transporter n=1 Tax=Candidatus Laterigemmans baculatus TaxID=2770505 RepID=UPI0013DA90E8|nr:DUF1559 domain-containing protein [Candidatus Laterigemmans baculatus]
MYRSGSRLALSLVSNVALFACFSSASIAADTDALDLLKPLLSSQTVAVVGVETQALERDSAVALVERVMPVGTPYATRVADRVVAMQRILEDGDVEEVYFVFDLFDPFGEMPFVVVPQTESLNADALTVLLEQGQDRDVQSRPIGSATVFGAASTLERLANLETQPSSAIEEALEEMEDSAVWAVVAANDDQRRAVEVVQPRLPVALGGGSIHPLTRGIRWITLRIDSRPNPTATLTLQASDATAATELREVAERSVVSLQTHAPFAQEWPELARHLSSLLPTREGDQLRLNLDASSETLQHLLQFIAEPIQSGLRAEARKHAMRQLKHLSLAIHAYHDTFGHLPTAAATDEQGRPLLSWRVQLLPYLGERELYEKFRLDEAWDSAHNRELIPQMPEVFYIPLSRHLQRDGRANFAVPGGEGSMFPPGEVARFQQVTDGLSNTIMVTEVDDEHAEIWTKPGAYGIDPENPERGLGGHFPGVFLTAYGDGSARAVPLDLPKDSLRGLFTRSGGETVQW